MALTNEKPKESIQTIKLLADMAMGFELFKQYGLEKLVKDIHSLTESEQEKAKYAKDNISRHESLIAEQKKLQQRINDDSVKNQGEFQRLSDGKKKLEKEAEELKKWENDLRKQFEELKQSKFLLAEKQNEIDVKNSKLDEAKAKVDITQKEASKIISELKARADKMKGLAEGL